MMDIEKLLNKISEIDGNRSIRQMEIPEECLEVMLFNPLLPLKKYCIYVSDEDTVLGSLSELKTEKNTFFISSMTKDDKISKALSDCNVFFSELPLFELHKKVSIASSEILQQCLSGNVPEKHSAAMFELIKLLSSDAPAVEERFRELVSQLKGKTYKYFRISLIRFSEPDSIKVKEAFLDAQSIFPKCNLTVFNDQIFVLSSSQKFHFEVIDDKEILEQYLSKYNAYVITCPSSQKSWGLQQMCRQLINSADVAWTIHMHMQESRILHFSDYAIYHAIDLFSEQFDKTYGHDDIMFMCHPYIITLQRYDNSKNSDLCGFLTYFLLSGHSISRTAEHFHMHRNTAIYQRDKIIQLIHYQFDDPDKDFSLLFSLYLTNYLKLYKGRIIKSLEYKKTEYLDQSSPL